MHLPGIKDFYHKSFDIFSLENKFSHDFLVFYVRKLVHSKTFIVLRKYGKFTVVQASAISILYHFFGFFLCFNVVFEE